MKRPALLVIAGLGAFSGAVRADDQCRVVDVDFTPAPLAAAQVEPYRPPSQMVIWVEKADGTFVDTVYITAKTGTYGIGNRPGEMDFNSGPSWPYGRRISTFPVWAHRNGEPFKQLGFADGQDDHLSHSPTFCSQDHFFCRPILDEGSEKANWDAETCPSAQVYTDKGTYSTDPTARTGYPPRADVMPSQPDSPDVSLFNADNPFDAVSRATPAENIPASTTWSLPNDMAAGNYVLWAEVSREFDHNATYSVDAYPSPVTPYGEYGEAYRGQPSVIYKVPFTLGTTDDIQSTLEYVGYGDPDGLDGNVREPDSTISTGVAGSGAERLAVRADGGNPYRLRVSVLATPDPQPPGAPDGLEVMDVTTKAAQIQFVAPGDDGEMGKASGYEVRYRVGEAITEANFADSQVLTNFPMPEAAGTIQSLDLTGLLFDTDYSVAIRAVDDCHKAGPISTVEFRTAPRKQGEVDACFIATAAYGSVMAPDVAMLRQFRDAALKNSTLGQLVIESYYTFGPAVAGAIGESDPLREVARALLAPIVTKVRGYLH